MDNRLVLITGAGSGIGRATALRFARDGAIVIVTDVNLRAAKETVALIRQRAGCAHAATLNVADSSAWARLAKKVRREHGVPDVVVNNAGYTTAGRFVDHDASDWERMLAVNVSGVIYGARVFAEQMIEAGVHGSIVNVASGAAYIPIPLSSMYCATKAAVAMAGECLRLELEPEGITVTSICPGVIDTGFYRAAEHVGVDVAEAEGRRTLSDGLVKRIGHDPDLVARAIVRASSSRRGGMWPVGIESSLGYAISRVTPGLLRFGARFVKADLASSAATRALPQPILDWLVAA